MKLYVKICLLTVLIGVGLSTHAKSLTPMDSIFVSVDNGLRIEISTYDYSLIKEDLSNDFLLLSQLLDHGVIDYSEKENIELLYVPNQELSIKKREKKEIIKINDQGFYKDFSRNLCVIESALYRAEMHFSDLQQLTDTLLVNQLMEMFELMPVKTRKSFSYHFTIKDREVTMHEDLGQYNGSKNTLVIDMAFGTSLIKERPICDYSLRLAFTFSEKGYAKHECYLSNQFMYVLGNTDDVRTNYFLNLGYRRNFSSNMLKPNWGGVELGYLVNGNGNFFGSNTVKFGLSKELGRGFVFSPCVYMTHNFSKFYPGLRIGFGF